MSSVGEPGRCVSDARQLPGANGRASAPPTNVVSDSTAAACAPLASVLSRRINAGELARGDRVDVGGESFEVEGFEPFCADGCQVDVRTSDGQQLTVGILQP